MPHVSSTAPFPWDTTGGPTAWLRFEYLPVGTRKKLEAERDAALAQVREKSNLASMIAKRARELEAEVAMLRPAIQALNAERERYEALLRGRP